MSDHSFAHLHAIEASLRKERGRCVCMRLSGHPPHEGRCGLLLTCARDGRGVFATHSCSCTGTLHLEEEEKGYPA